ncbi:hypothetical protein B0H19DRAFT_1084633 [Mycena capillaripes]|nr:hypothetical protein B0H19DRAFT_1084633 [Mycena capillaripes]
MYLGFFKCTYCHMVVDSAGGGLCWLADVSATFDDRCYTLEIEIPTLQQPKTHPKYVVAYIKASNMSGSCRECIKFKEEDMGQEFGARDLIFEKVLVADWPINIRAECHPLRLAEATTTISAEGATTILAEVAAISVEAATTLVDHAGEPGLPTIGDSPSLPAPEVENLFGMYGNWYWIQQLPQRKCLHLAPELPNATTGGLLLCELQSYSPPSPRCTATPTMCAFPIIMLDNAATIQTCVQLCALTQSVGC